MFKHNFNNKQVKRKKSKKNKETFLFKSNRKDKKLHFFEIFFY